MLQRLAIQNYILIDELDIDFHNGLTIITGETGAGKSILLGALSLILGQRADSSSLLNKNKKCIIEGLFNIKGYNLETFFATNELDFENETTIRREITAEGKSRAFINDTPVGLNVLKDIASALVDIHSQHETLTLNNSGFQLSVVDAFAKHDTLLADYRERFVLYVKKQQMLDELRDRERKSKADLDYFQFQFNELDEAGLKPGEQEQLETELQTLNHAEEIKENLQKAVSQLASAEENIIQQLSGVSTFVGQLSRYDTKYNELQQRLKSSVIELKDINDELAQAEQHVLFSPAKAEEINNRLDIIYKLQHKHHVKTIEELLKLHRELNEKLNNIGSLETEIAKLEKEIDALHQKLLKCAHNISVNRSSAIPKIEKAVKDLLSDLAMPNAMLKIEMETSTANHLNKDGLDKITFTFSANKGTDFKALNKVASGGELSRLMLTIKSQLAKLTSLPTIIFDEIDTGISGDVAARVGAIMQQISSNHQVIAITHLPQIAGKGNDHFLVYKSDTQSTTRTGIRRLNENERINEIARMLSGEKLTDAAVIHAKELMT